ncbi:MAG: hypothetical protein HYS06_00550 [Methylocystis sp.]|nr:hypothetical protein [Methylocystis sp.]
MTISDNFLPVYQFSERHEGNVASKPNHVLDVIDTLDDRDDNLVRVLITLREAPARIVSAMGLSTALKHRPRFGMANFTKLERNDKELVYGLVGRFWRPSFGLEQVADAETFVNFNRPGVAKLIMHFIAMPNEAGGVRLVTETRVFCPDLQSRLLFTPYWWAIRTASGLVRQRMLALIKKKVEHVTPADA